MDITILIQPDDGERYSRGLSPEMVDRWGAYLSDPVNEDARPERSIAENIVKCVEMVVSNTMRERLIQGLQQGRTTPEQIQQMMDILNGH